MTVLGASKQILTCHALKRCTPAEQGYRRLDAFLPYRHGNRLSGTLQIPLPLAIRSSSSSALFSLLSFLQPFHILVNNCLRVRAPT